MSELMPPLRVRLHPEDHEKYGGDWYTYDENAIFRLPVGEQRDIERAIGMPILDMANRGRQSYVDGLTAQIWVARRMAGVAEAFDDFSPLSLLAEWEVAGPARGADPPVSGSSSPRAAPKKSSTGASRSSPSSHGSRPAS